MHPVMGLILRPKRMYVDVCICIYDDYIYITFLNVSMIRYSMQVSK